MLGKQQAYRLLRLILVLTWSIALLGIAVWAYQVTPSPIKGKLQVSDALVDCYRADFTCLLDFRVRNSGNRPVSLSRIRFASLRVDSIENIRTEFPIARVGDIDLSSLAAPGSTLEVPVARLINPTETERLGVSVGARLPAGVFRRWQLGYELIADGDVDYATLPKTSSSSENSLFAEANATFSRSTLAVTLPWDIDAHLKAPIK